jgi:2-succinyl-5-enolpyruvyl-6-hydroxy-3-cyclohexene-1-carboxylate synthase
MTTATDTHLLLRAFVDELARCGLRDACTSPGSRCTPLVLSLAREPRLRCHSHIDERCGGFFALGLAKATGLPAAVTCTSGTAAAELLPAAIEAHEAGVPLLILTADRPPELRENGAGQTIDQLKLFGGAAKWFFEVGTHAASEQRLRWMRTLACRAYWRTLEGRAGVVHLNFALREPLVSGATELPPDDTGRPNGAPYVRRPSAQLHAPGAMAELSTLLASCTRGVLVAGRSEHGAPPLADSGMLAETGTRAEGACPPASVKRVSPASAAAEFCAAARWPLLADPLSGARRGEGAVAHYDTLLRDEAFAAQMRPDVVIRAGALPASKPLRQWLAGLRAVPHVLLDPLGDWQDPEGLLSGSLAVDPVCALQELTGEVRSLALADPDWLERWRSADERAAEALLGVLAAGGLSEPAVAAELGVLLPAQATLFVASSMPVRDVESFWPVREDPPRVLCNRGANGIDGTVSSAFGAAAAEAGAGGNPVILLIGDVALAHDIGGLLAARRLGLALTIVLIDNSGGGIFDFLPVAGAPLARSAGARGGTPAARGDRPTAGSGPAGDPAQEDLYTRHIATPTGLDFAQAARLYGLEHETVADVPAFRAALERALTRRPPRAGIIEVRTDRAANVALHSRAWEAVAEALSPPGAAAAPPA